MIGFVLDGSPNLFSAILPHITMSAPLAAPGAGWSWSQTRSAYTRVEPLAASARVWLVVEDDRFAEHPFMYIIVGAECVVCIDTGDSCLVSRRHTPQVGAAAPRLDGRPHG